MSSWTARRWAWAADAAAEEVVDVDLGGHVAGVAVVCDLNPERADTAFLRMAREQRAPDHGRAWACWPGRARPPTSSGRASRPRWT